MMILLRAKRLGLGVGRTIETLPSHTDNTFLFSKSWLVK